jgi:hypothetical protein
MLRSILTRIIAPFSRPALSGSMRPPAVNLVSEHHKTKDQITLQSMTQKRQEDILHSGQDTASQATPSFSSSCIIGGVKVTTMYEKGE